MATQQLVSWSLLLLLLVNVYGGEAGRMADLRQQQEMIIIRNPAEHDGHGGFHHSSHMDASVKVFFHLKDLKVGNTMPVYFRRRDVSTLPHTLSREQASSIPFSSNDLPYLLDYFSLSKDSPQAKAMAETMRECELQPIQGETKFCATSFESMLEFAQSVLGSNSQLQLHTTTHTLKSSTLFQNYTIIGSPKEIPAPGMVACHNLPYLYTILYCHTQESEIKVFKVPLMGENGDGVDALAVCHMDTSHFSPNHVSFKLLGLQPGTLPVCHFFPEDNFVMVPVLP